MIYQSNQSDTMNHIASNTSFSTGFVETPKPELESISQALVENTIVAATSEVQNAPLVRKKKSSPSKQKQCAQLVEMKKLDPGTVLIGDIRVPLVSKDTSSIISTASTPRSRCLEPCSHAALRLLELMQTQFAGPRVMGFLELPLDAKLQPFIGTVRRVCKVLHAVPLASYLERVFERTLQSNAAKPSDHLGTSFGLQRVLCGAPVHNRPRCIQEEDMWPPIARHFALAAMLRVPGLEHGWCTLCRRSTSIWPGCECLRDAASNGHVDTVHALLKAKAPVNLSRSTGGPLHWAAAGGHIACLTALLEANADVEQNDIEEATPLINAAEGGHDACVTVLLEAMGYGTIRNPSPRAAELVTAAQQEWWGYEHCTTVVDVLCTERDWNTQSLEWLAAYRT